jgi:hypothetical protein
VLFQGLRFIGGGNFELGKCDDHRPDAYVRFGSWSNMPAPRTSNDGSTDEAGRADVVQHCIELIPQFDYLGEGQARVPSATEFCDHLGKPGSLRIARWHLRLLYLRPALSTPLRHFRQTPHIGSSPEGDYNLRMWTPNWVSSVLGWSRTRPMD